MLGHFSPGVRGHVARGRYGGMTLPKGSIRLHFRASRSHVVPTGKLVKVFRPTQHAMKIPKGAPLVTTNSWCHCKNVRRDIELFLVFDLAAIIVGVKE